MRFILLQIYLALEFIFRFLVGSLYGILILLIILYFALPYFTDIQPYSFDELLLFVMNLDPQYKVAILTSLITVVGFLIAFQTATTTWKQQMHTNLSLQAANDIDSPWGHVYTFYKNDRGK